MRLQSYCKDCASKYSATYNANRSQDQIDSRNAMRRSRYVVRGPEYDRSADRKYSLSSRYKLTIEQYDALLAKQHGLCAIDACGCKAEHIDHDHRCCPGVTTCGQCIRGVLCAKCNKMLGLARDSIDVLDAASHYLNSGRVYPSLYPNELVDPVGVMNRQRAGHVKRRYGLTESEYEWIWRLQDGKCSICSDPATHVDHDHACCGGNRSCGMCVRGLLCRDHNLMIGLGRDSYRVMDGAMEYLVNHHQRLKDLLSV